MDTRSPEQRRRIMQSVKQKDTAPEMVVRRLLHAAGYRYRLHRKDMPGRPDIVFGGRRKVIFVHGTLTAAAKVIRFVEQRFPGMQCRAFSAQFMADQVVALFELTLQDDEVKVVEERHYRLVPASELDQDAIRAYR